MLENAFCQDFAIRPSYTSSGHIRPSCKRNLGQKTLRPPQATERMRNGRPEKR
jgi:hypothetical protein